MGVAACIAKPATPLVTQCKAQLSSLHHTIRCSSNTNAQKNKHLAHACRGWLSRMQKVALATVGTVSLVAIKKAQRYQEVNRHVKEHR